MSDTVRHELANAASSVAGITAHPYFVQRTQAGHAYVRLDRIDYPNRFGGVRRWNVVVLLPQDAKKAEQYLEERLPDLHAALSPHLVITEVVPQRIEFPDAGVLPCVFINGHREED